ncbi:MAG: hypothetical protein IPK16_18875 [Anaerolineales bacterium]|nr:hypothetical protein [Anaerolineales bacterium]
MKFKRALLATLVIVLFLMPTTLVMAQQETGPAQTPTDLYIAWPQPVTEVHGVIQIVGTADVPNQAFYRLEAISVNPDYTIPENAAWIPLTTNVTAPVDNGVLANVDTTALPDGLYMIRVAAFTGSVTAPTLANNYQTGPIRVNNLHSGGTGVTPTPAPSPTAMPANTPAYVTPGPGISSVKVRACDIADDNSCPWVGLLSGGQTAQIVGLANDGSGWLQVTLPGGLTGWVSPTVVTVVGNTQGIPQISPPAPLPTPVPPPPPPPNQTPGVVHPNGISIQGGTPQCGKTFNVEVNVGNYGGTASSPGTVTLQDIASREGVVTTTNYGSYPSLQPNANYVVVIPMQTTTYVNEPHELVAINDGQQVSKGYTLKSSSACGSNPPPPPPPPPPSGPVNYKPGQCTIKPENGAPYYNYPFGQAEGHFGNNQKVNAESGQMVNGKRWYQVTANGLQVWVNEHDMHPLPSGCKNF